MARRGAEPLRRQALDRTAAARARRYRLCDGYAEVADAYQRSRRDGGRLIYRVDVQNSGTGTLFIAGIPEFVNVDARNLLLTPEDSLRVLGAVTAKRCGMRFRRIRDRRCPRH